MNENSINDKKIRYINKKRNTLGTEEFIDSGMKINENKNDDKYELGCSSVKKKKKLAYSSR